ncbi:leucine-rich repeat domain-containing protein [Pontiellaceae bacterium B1224]|nr:leucine-rich repeat domain-containing protein [Pontiellaceae bacterium B1224]
MNRNSLLLFGISLISGVFSAQALEFGDYSYTVNSDDSATITDYTGSNTVLNIPSSIDGHIVTEIGETAFSDYPSAPEYFQEIILPDTVVNIGYRAFAACIDLHTIAFSASLTNISGEAFIYCNSLTNLTLDGMIETLGYRAFAYCEDLQHLSTGNALRTIGDSAFYFCQNLASVELGDGMDLIGDLAFIDCSSLTNLALGNSVHSIGERAFQRCDSLLSVTIPHSVTNMGYDTFYDCENLQSVVFGDGMTYVPYRGFWGCASLTNVTFGASIASIEPFAFSWCTSLPEVSVPEGVHSITWAFSDCISLERASLPASFTNCPFESFVFMGCSSLTSIVVAAGNPIYKDIDGVWFNKEGDDLLMYPEGRAGAYTIPAGTRYTSSSFGNCTGLTAVNIPDTMLYMGVSLFNGCTNLSSITVAADSQVFQSLNGVLYDDTLAELLKYPAGKTAKSFSVHGHITTLRQSSFSGAAHLESIHLPETLVEIGSYTFRGCANLRSLTIPDSVPSIPSHAFTDCVALTNIALPDGITIIENSTFENCASLTSIQLSTNLTSISKSAFQGCSALTKVTIPDSVVELGDHAFSDCDSLERVYFGTTVDEIGSYTFDDCDALENLYFKGEPPSSLGHNALPTGEEVAIYRLLDSDSWPVSLDGIPVYIWNPTIRANQPQPETANFVMTVTGPNNDSVVIEQSFEPGGEWFPCLTNALSGGTGQFTVPSNATNAFYRATMQD